MAEFDGRREAALDRWLDAAWRGRTPPSPADWRDAAALARALRSGARDPGELRRLSGLGAARCSRAARLVEALLRYPLALEDMAAGPSPGFQTEGDARPQ